MLMASVGCGQVADVPDTGSGAGAAGSDGPVSGLTFAQSGSRLVALGYSSNEARLFRTFHDTQLGFDCDFVADQASGDEQRCVPSLKVDVVYTDAECGDPAAWIQPYELDAVEGTAVSGGRYDLPPDCPGAAAPRREAFRIGEQLNEEVIGGPPVPLYRKQDGRCVTAYPPAKTTPPTFRLRPMAETELVRGERVSVDVGDGLRLMRLIAEDGAELNLSVTGADRKPCELQRDGECVTTPIARPAGGGAGQYGSALDADCNEPAFQLPYPASCGPAQFGIEDDGLQPFKIWSMDEAGARFKYDYVLPITNPPTFACTPRSPDDTTWMATRGRDLTGTLPTATKLRRGSGPLHVDWFTVGTNELLPVRAQLVNEAGQPCQVLPADDGTQRCATVISGEPTAELTSFPEVSVGPI